MRASRQGPRARGGHRAGTKLVALAVLTAAASGCSAARPQAGARPHSRPSPLAARTRSPEPAATVLPGGSADTLTADVARQLFTSAPVVVVANDNGPAALAAAGEAQQIHAPLLLTEARPGPGPSRTPGAKRGQTLGTATPQASPPARGLAVPIQGRPRQNGPAQTGPHRSGPARIRPAQMATAPSTEPVAPATHVPPARPPRQATQAWAQPPMPALAPAPTTIPEPATAPTPPSSPQPAGPAGQAGPAGAGQPPPGTRPGPPHQPAAQVPPGATDLAPSAGPAPPPGPPRPPAAARAWPRPLDRVKWLNPPAGDPDAHSDDHQPLPQPVSPEPCHV